MTKARRFIGFGSQALVALMPFHAFLSVWLGHLFGYRSLIQSWKEVLIVAMGLAAIAIWAKSPEARKRLAQPYNLLAIAYIAVSLTISLFSDSSGSLSWWFGLKTNLVWVGLFVIVQLASTLALRRRLLRLMLATTAIISLLALVQAWFLPPDWLTALGYGPSTIRPKQLVDPAVQAIRAFSTLGGPNQLGAFLILPLCYVVAAAFKKYRWWHPAMGAVIICAIAVSQSRSAWLGAGLGVITVILLHLPRRAVLPAAAALTGLALIASWMLPHALNRLPKLQYYLLHTGNRFHETRGSDAQRLGSYQAGLKIVQQQPWGHGLGTAGPASKRTEQPLISENYYLQLAIEVGVLGLALFLLWQAAIVRRLWQLRARASARGLIGAMAGLAVVNLFLHGWADSTLALVFATMAGSCMVEPG